MNAVISDTAEYGNYLFSHAAVPMLQEFMKCVDSDIIGKGTGASRNVDNLELIAVNEAIRNHPIEVVGKMLRGFMTEMKSLS